MEVISQSYSQYGSTKKGINDIFGFFAAQFDYYPPIWMIHSLFDDIIPSERKRKIIFEEFLGGNKIMETIKCLCRLWKTYISGVDISSK